MPSPTPAVTRFERIEKKFRLTDAQYEALLPLILQHLAPDGYGEKTVCNVFYDTPDCALIRRSIQRPRFKEKLRVRSYGEPGDTDRVFVEIKRKLNGIGYKRRLSLPLFQVRTLLSGQPVGSDDPQVEAELLAFAERYRPVPVVCLTYRRTAYLTHDDSLRVTFDRDLRFRLTDPEKMTTAGTEPVLGDEPFLLMELKAPGALPRWLTDEMSRLKITQAPFSKVGTCYTRHMAHLSPCIERKDNPKC